MQELKPSRWDRDDIRPEGVLPDQRTAAQRCVRRVRLIERFLERCVGPEGPIGAEAVGAELRRRTVFWSGVLGGGAGTGADVGLSGVAKLMTGLLSVIIAGGCCGFLGGGLAAAGAIVVSVVMLVVLGRRIGRTTRLAHSVAARACPDCGYDLRGAAPAVAPAIIGGWDAGPTRCPECGASWPLVLPLVPVELLTPALTDI